MTFQKAKPSNGNLPYRVIPCNLPYTGVHVECGEHGTTKLYIHGFLIVYCQVGLYWWKTAAYIDSYKTIVEWFHKAYFPDTRLVSAGFSGTAGLYILEPIKTREEITV